MRCSTRQSTNDAPAETLCLRDEEDANSIATPGSPLTKWGAVARQPTVVHHQTRAKSREVLLTDYRNFSDDSSDDDSAKASPMSLRKDSFGADDEEKPVAQGIQRATSVSLDRHHARHVSAGSAKLLDVKPRASGDAKRLSFETKSSGH